ncbi:MAG: ABC transporter ATP-binding protein [Candidatus Nanopelagicales bacterium]|nr:ABC transporter ATP-binding protein [Candidatus Nanopelagicales bacterium]
MSAEAPRREAKKDTDEPSAPLRPPTPKDDTNQIIGRLTGYMIKGVGKPKFVLAVVLTFFSMAFLTAIPFLIGQAVNTISDPDGSMETLGKWVFAILVALGLYIVLAIIAVRLFAKLATNGLANLQRALFDHLQKLSLNFFDRQPIGQLLSRVTNDTEAVALYFETAVAAVVQSLLQLLLIVSMMLVLDWQLTLAALLVVPIMLIVGSVLGRTALPAFAKLQEELADLSAFQEETITGHKVIISNRRQDFAITGDEEHAAKVFRTGSRAFFAALLQFPVTQALSMIMVVIVLFVGGLLVVDGSMSVGEVIAFVGYAGLLASPLSEIANLVTTTMNGVAGGRQIFALLDEKPKIVDPPHARPYEFKGGRVEFREVDFSYVPGRQILYRNSFVAEPGQMIGICGPTGAGKSTIINILTRYYDIDHGQILIDDQNLREMSLESLREQVGTVLQEAFLFSDTVMNNLLYARKDATRDDAIAAAREANAHEFIERLPQGYDTMMIERGANLSQGQRQMITIARAMVANPKILVLDEATSNVDTRTEKLIQEGLRRLMRGRTSFVIAHRLSTIRHADRILVVDGGHIVEQGTHDELMAQGGAYQALYLSQFKGKGPGGTGGSATGTTFTST